ncbi:hypothetical protein ACFL36_01400 [Thermodesulfobacteriota bacterium]
MAYEMSVQITFIYPKFYEKTLENSVKNLVMQLTEIEDIKISFDKNRTTIDPEIIKQILIYGVKIGAFTAIYKLIQLFLKVHNNCSIRINTGSGNVMEITNLTTKSGKKIWLELSQQDKSTSE